MEQILMSNSKKLSQSIYVNFLLVIVTVVSFLPLGSSAKLPAPILTKSID